MDRAGPVMGLQKNKSDGHKRSGRLVLWVVSSHLQPWTEAEGDLALSWGHILSME